MGIHRNADLPRLTRPTTILPGTFAGVLTPPASAGGVVYAADLNAPSTLEPDRTAYFGGNRLNELAGTAASRRGIRALVFRH